MHSSAAFDVHGLVRSLENEITSKPGNFSAEIVKSTLPPIESVKSGAVPLVRARELFAKTAAAKLGTLPVMFSSYTTEELRDIAVKAVDGKFTAANQNFVQSPRPDEGNGWVKSNRTCLDMLDAIYYNLQRGADALKVEVGKMSTAALSLAALNFGLADAKLAESIQSLSQKDYDALLVLAGQNEMQDVNKRLTTALKALRDSKVMLAQISKE